MLKDVASSKTVKPTSFLSRAAAQGRNYTTAVGWLLQRAFRGRVRTLFLALGLSSLYLATQAAGIYCIYWYARLLETGGAAELPFLEHSLDARSDIRLLWAVVIARRCLLHGQRRVSLPLASRCSQPCGTTLREKPRRTGAADRRCCPIRGPVLRAGFIMNFGLPKLTSGCRFGYVTSVIF